MTTMDNSTKMTMTDNPMNMLKTCLLLTRLLLVLVILSIVGVSRMRSPVGSVSLVHSMVAPTVPNAESISMSDGDFAFDTNWPNSDCLQQAVHRLKVDEISAVNAPQKWVQL